MSNSCDDWPADGGNWYRLVGSGEIINFKLLQGNELFLDIMRDECVNGTCVFSNWIPNGGNILFQAETGIEYYFRLNGYTNNNYKIIIDCESPIPGEGCGEAILVSYNDTITIDSGNYLNNYNCGYMSSSPGLWYKFYSTHRSITQIDFINDLNLTLNIVKNSCEGTCLNEVNYDYSNKLYEFNTEANTWYFLSINSYYLNENFQFVLQDIPGSFISPCDLTQQLNNLILPNMVYPNGLIQASKNISSSSTTIMAGGEYIWQAPDSISLLPGFEIEKNALFELRISDCQ